MIKYKNMMNTFQKNLKVIIFMMLSCLLFPKTTLSADGMMPKTFSSAGNSKSVLAADKKAEKTLSSTVSIQKGTLPAKDKLSSAGSQAVSTLKNDGKELSSAVYSKATFNVTDNEAEKTFPSVVGIQTVAVKDNKAKVLSSGISTQTAKFAAQDKAEKTLSSVASRTVSTLKSNEKVLPAAASTQTIPVKDDKAKVLSSGISAQTAIPVVQSQAGKTLSPISSLFSSGKEEKVEAKQESKQIDNSPFALSKAPKYIGAVTFEADEKQLSAIPLIKGVYELASEAQVAHNTKQQLPSMRVPFLEYEKIKKMHEKSIDLLFSSVIAARDYFANYYGKDKADDLWFGQGCHLKQTYLGQKCAKMNGCKKPYNVSEFEPAVRYSIVCQDDVFFLTDYPKLRGLLGQSVSAYKLAKAEAAAALDINSENCMEKVQDKTGTVVMDTNLSALDSDDSQDDDIDAKVRKSVRSEKTLSEEELSETGGGAVLNPEEEETSQEELREQDLIRWQIGVAAAQKIGQDMATGGKLYGVPNTVYPLWEDEKRVYNQYLKEKYKNIALYFSSNEVALIDFDVAAILNETLQINEAYVKEYADSLAAQMLESSEIKRRIDALRAKLEEEKETLKAQNLTDIQAAKNRFSDHLKSSSLLAEMKISQENEMLQLEQKMIADVAAVQTSLQKKYDEIDEVMERLNKNKVEYRDNLSQQDEAKSFAKGQDMSMALEDKRKQEDPSYISGLKNDAIATKNKNLQIAADLQPKINAVKEEVDTDQNKVKRLRNEVAGVKKSIDAIKKAYIRDAVLMENKHHQDMKKALAERGSDTLSPSAFLGDDVDGSLKAMMLDAAGLRNEFRALAVAEVMDTYQDIKSFENLYYPQTYPKILERHQEMIDNIKKIQTEAALHSLTKFVFGGHIFGTTAFPLFECSDCENEDEEYYVGFEGTKNDFFAPKRMVASYTPPVREIIHFDITDFDAINKYEPENGAVTYACPPIGCPGSRNPKTTKAEFLKLGQQFPAVWERILTSRGFVERDIDIEDILMDGAAPSCGEGFMSSVCPSTKVENLSRSFIEAKGERFVPGVSELSIFFKYDNGLTFTDTIMDLCDEVENTADYFSGNDASDEEQVQEYVDLILDIEKRFLERTQVGDVLQFVNLEQTYQTRMDQLKVKIDETRRSIEETIRKLACEIVVKDTDYLRSGEESTRIVSSEFLADDETYESIFNCLDNGKNIYIQSALNLQQKLPVLNDELMKRKKKSDDMLACMQKDNEELVILSDDTAPSTELDEEIKSQRVDAQVKDKYKKEADKQMSKQTFPSPYKANFGPGDPYVP